MSKGDCDIKMSFGYKRRYRRGSLSPKEKAIFKAGIRKGQKKGYKRY